MMTSLNLKSQSLDSLKICYESFHNKSLQADLAEFQIKEKYKLLKFLPSLGYDAFRQSPIITFSFNSISQRLETNAINKAKIKSIQEKYEVLKIEKLQEIEKLYKELLIKKEVLKYKKKVFEIEKEIFELQSQLYATHQSKPQDFLAAKLKYYTSEMNFLELESSIIIAEMELKSFCKCQ